MTAQEALRAAIAQHQAGQLELAANIYRQLLQAAPGMADAWHLLGVTHLQRGDTSQAVELIQHAIVLVPQADYYANLAEALRQAKQPAQAIAAAQQALKQKSDHAAAANALGLAQLDAGEPEAAVATLQTLVQRLPGYVQGWNNLSTAFKAAHRLADAVVAIRQAIALQPSNPVLHYNLGEALRAEQRYDDALVAYDQALALAPQQRESARARADTLVQLGRRAAAEAQFRALLADSPHDAEAWNNFGLLLDATGRHGEAIDAYQQALVCQPDHLAPLNNLAIAWRIQGALTPAEQTLRRALQLDPEHGQSWVNLGLVLKAQGRIGEAIEATRQGLQRLPQEQQVASNLVFDLHYVWPPLRQEAMRAAHIAAVSQLLTPQSPRPPAWPRAAGAPLRIGYLSPDLRRHPVGYLLAGILPQHDRSRLHITCLADVAAPDAMTQRLQQCADAWHDIAHLDDVAVVELIRRERIDLLVDLAGHSAKQRLGVLARRPARVTVTWLGYFDTTGLSAVDYILTDPNSTPVSALPAFMEKPLYLPHCRFCYSPPPYAPLPAPPPCLQSAVITFGSFNNYAKLNDGVCDLWAKLLLSVPNSRLLLKTVELHDELIRERCLQRWVARGIAPERIILRSYSPHEAMLAEYADIDIALDPFPFTGGMTTLEALWMGVPVLTLAGASMVARQGLAILRSIGLHAWIADDEAAYLAAAQAHAADPTALATLRLTLRERMLASTLCDAKAFAAHLDACLLQAFAAHADAHP